VVSRSSRPGAGLLDGFGGKIRRIRWKFPEDYRDPQLLDGQGWAAVRGDVLTSLGLPSDPDGLLAGHAQALDAAYREVAG